MALPISVVVVSRGRPLALMRCLNGLAQLDYDPFEIVVVACPDGQVATRARKDADHIKLIAFDDPNISTARNLGIAAAAGDVVAFIDDDAVPEPLWLGHLARAFDAPDVAAAGGYVIGRNGISYQWTARSIDPTGEASPLDFPDMEPQVLRPSDTSAIKTEGTNMAVRRDVLAEIGGFDPGFRFYMDETDLNWRLARAGHATAIVPLAQVHHGFAPSARRAADRSPRNLYEIGASKARFLQKHSLESVRDAAWREFRQAQHLRLLRFMQRGPLGADDVLRLLRGLDKGRKEGAGRDISALPHLPRAAEGLRPYPGRKGAKRITLAGRIWRARTLRRKAARLVREGAIVSLYLFSPTPKAHRVTFTDDGVWEQTGGRFGPSDRRQPRWRYWRFSARRDAEIVRSLPVRGQLDDTFVR